MCALLVGLPDINVVGVEDRSGQPLRVHGEGVEAVVGDNVEAALALHDVGHRASVDDFDAIPKSDHCAHAGCGAPLFPAVGTVEVTEADVERAVARMAARDAGRARDAVTCMSR